MPAIDYPLGRRDQIFILITQLQYFDSPVVSSVQLAARVHGVIITSLLVLIHRLRVHIPLI